MTNNCRFVKFVSVGQVQVANADPTVSKVNLIVNNQMPLTSHAVIKKMSMFIPSTVVTPLRRLVPLRYMMKQKEMPPVPDNKIICTGITPDCFHKDSTRMEIVMENKDQSWQIKRQKDRSASKIQSQKLPKSFILAENFHKIYDREREATFLRTNGSLAFLRLILPQRVTEFNMLNFEFNNAYNLT
uniref:Uncharacterized protein n=1 Tax=Setaria digitata TaxID=48799 RepID=A0A915Q3D2_9BILA